MAAEAEIRQRKTVKQERMFLFYSIITAFMRPANGNMEDGSAIILA
jgi:hypothetical protein